MKIRDLSTWESFYWVAKDGNFTQASRRLNIGLSLISKRIASLEEELGVRLFQRSTRKVALTQDGRSLLPQVQSLLEDAQSLEEHFSDRDGIMGTIRIACVTAFAYRVLPSIIAKFSEIHPRVKIELEVSDALVDLIDHQIDLAIRVQEPSGADYIFKKLISNQLVACASPHYLKVSKRLIRKPEDLLLHRVLALKDYEGCQFMKSAIKVGDLLGARSIACESGLFLTELALQGQGIAIRSIWDVGPLLKTGALVQVLKGYPLEPFGDVYAVIPTRRLLAARVRSFMDFLLAELTET